jgi:prevent-host-death family protein
VATVGVRELKNRLSEFLRRVGEGERITVTDRGRPVAVLGPAEPAADDEDIRRMVREGLATWSGGKPRGARRPARIKGKPMHETIREDRR